MGNYGDILHFQYNCISTLHIRPLTPRHAQEKPQPPSLAQDGLLFLCAVLSCVFSPRGLIPPSCPMDIFFWGGGGNSELQLWPRRSPAMASVLSAPLWRPPSGILSMCVLCRVCHMFPPLVSTWDLFPVLFKCDYELILVQLCLSQYL